MQSTKASAWLWIGCVVSGLAAASLVRYTLTPYRLVAQAELAAALALGLQGVGVAL